MSKVFFVKGAFFVFAAIMLFSAASASISVVLPVDVRLENKDEFQLGNVAVGETFSVVIQKKSGNGFDWDSLSVNGPNSWIVNYRLSDKTLIADISIPGNAPEATSILTFTLSSSERPLASESFKGIVNVRKSLLAVTMDDLKQFAAVGGNVSYRFVASNDSIAEHRISIESSLPNYWFEPKEVILQPKQKQELALNLTPRADGSRNFSFFVKSRQNSFSKSFNAELDVSSTLQGKISAPAYAFPFFSFSNFAFYLFNSLWVTPYP
ncbi:MAG: hypothetical protein PHD95_01220 [Candidatus ainarchaeum sp.]|nr:hypothetical protein [Candidatus ainarchaeum sp.]